MVEKKIRIKIPKENKIRAELQKEIDSVCPFCDNGDVGHFEIHHIDNNPSNNLSFNLLLLCRICHSKITKGDIIPIDVLEKKIALLTKKVKPKNEIGKVMNFNSSINNGVVGDHNNITIKQAKKIVKEKYPFGCIGFDTVKANYIGHLIKRYNEYKEYETHKENMNYKIFGSHLKKKFKIGPTRTIYNLPIGRFEELANYIQSRIDNTKLAKVKGFGHKNYSSLDEYKIQVG